MNGDDIDPEDLPLHPEYTPAMIQVRGQGVVYVADYQTLESGWVRLTEWRDRRVKLPPHKIEAIREVRTEYYDTGTDGEYVKAKRVAHDEQREEASADDSGGKVVVAGD